jgi:hypothetical protein
MPATPNTRKIGRPPRISTPETRAVVLKYVSQDLRWRLRATRRAWTAPGKCACIPCAAGCRGWWWTKARAQAMSTVALPTPPQREGLRGKDLWAIVTTGCRATVGGRRFRRCSAPTRDHSLVPGGTERAEERHGDFIETHAAQHPAAAHTHTTRVSTRIASGQAWRGRSRCSARRGRRHAPCSCPWRA